MKKIKKVLLSLLAILGLITMTAASSVHADGDYTPKHLTVEFVPSSNAQKMSARVKPLAKLLEQQLHIPVTVTVSTNYKIKIRSHRKDLSRSYRQLRLSAYQFLYVDQCYHKQCTHA